MKLDLFDRLDTHTATPGPTTTRPIIEYSRIALHNAPDNAIDSHRNGTKLIALAFAIISDKSLASAVGEKFTSNLKKAFLKNASVSSPLYHPIFYIDIAEKLDWVWMGLYLQNNSRKTNIPPKPLSLIAAKP